LSGTALADGLDERGHTIVERAKVPDESQQIQSRLRAWCDGPEAPDLVVTTGGTGLGPRDVTPEATLQVLERVLPGIPEALRALGARSTVASYLSRGVAGVRGHSLIVNVAGSPDAARDAVPFLAEVAPHALHILRGGGHRVEEGARARKPGGESAGRLGDS
jgi:molybdenum cofactor synthesis domain-containing protein